MDEIELTYQSAGRSSLLVDSNGSSLQSRPENQKLLEIQELTLQTPTNGTTLVHNLTAHIYDKDHLLVKFSPFLTDYFLVSSIDAKIR